MLLRERLHAFLDAPFLRMSYTDAFAMLSQAQAQEEVEQRRPSTRPRFKHALRHWGQPLQTEHEKYLCDVVGQGVRGVVVTDYPESCKAFYMRRRGGSQDSGGDSGGDDHHDADDHNNRAGAVVSCFDLLVPRLGELVGGSMREERAWLLAEKMLDPQSASPLDPRSPEYRWYVELREFGTCPHGGFGLGFDRLLMHLTGLENIRDVVQVGRWKTRCDY